MGEAAGERNSGGNRERHRFRQPRQLSRAGLSRRAPAAPSPASTPRPGGTILAATLEGRTSMQMSMMGLATAGTRGGIRRARLPELAPMLLHCGMKEVCSCGTSLLLLCW